MDANHRKLGLSDLLDQDLSCYEYYYSLSKELRKKIKEMDVNTFEEMQDIVQQEQERRNLADLFLQDENCGGIRQNNV